MNADLFTECKTFAEIEAKLAQTRWHSIYNRLRDAPDDQIGKLARSMNDSLVLRTATAAVIPAIAEKIWVELNPKRVIKCKYCDFTVPKFARRRRGTGFDVMREHLGDAHPEKAKEIANAIFGSRESQEEAHEENPDHF